MKGGRRIIVAPDKFKGSLTAAEAARAIEAGFRAVPDCVREVVCVPMADGGEGTVDVFVESGARPEVRIVRGPLGRPVAATFAVTAERLAVIEMASASGLLLLAHHERDPMRASTYGTGELILAALDLGVEHIVLGIGGSATNDAGSGMLTALGARLLDANGAELPGGGAALAQLARIDLSGLDPRIGHTTIEVASDVDSALCGPTGASLLFGPQKGASAEQILTLDAALAHFADVTAASTGRDERATAGSGAAGGLGFGLMAYVRASLRPGVDIIAHVRGLTAQLAGADLCVTGEGRIDAQTLRGKTVAGVARLANAAGVPVIAFTGSLDASAEAALVAGGLAATFPIADTPMTLEFALQNAATLLSAACARVARAMLVPGSRLT